MRGRELGLILPTSFRKPETIDCFCLIKSPSLYKYLYSSLIIIGINNN